MTDFLDQLGSELLDAARRRPHTRTPTRSSAHARVARGFDDLRALGSGALLAGSVCAVAIVVAVVLVAGAGRAARHVAAAAGAPSPAVGVPGDVRTRMPCANRPRREVSEASPGGAVAELLAGDRRATQAQAAAAIRDVNLSRPAEIDGRGVRVVRFRSGVQVVLLGARTCDPATRAQPRPTVLAVVAGRSATTVTTVDLGTPAQIRSGRAFRSPSTSARAWSRIVTIAGRRRAVAMVPAGIVRLLCHGLGPDRRTVSFPVHRRVVLVSEQATHHQCDLES